MPSKPSYEELLARVQELEKVEKELVRNEQRNRFLIKATTSIYWATDASGGFVDPQPSWEKYTGQPWPEHQGFGWTKMIHPDDVNRILEVWSKATRTLSMYETWGRLWSVQLKQFRDFEVRAVPIMDADGSLCEWAGFIIDETDRKAAEREVVREARLRTNLLDNIPDCIALIMKKQTREIVAANKYASNAGAVFGKTCFEACFGKKEICPFCRAPELWESGEQQRVEVEYRGRWFESIWMDLSEDLYVHYIFDITDKQLNEERLRQAQKMESIGNLAGGIAHDFNNILSPIIAMAEMLMEDLPPKSLEYDNAREIFMAGKRGGDLVEQILTFSRRTEHKKVPVHLQRIVSEVLKLSRSTIPASTEIVQVIQSDCGQVLADPTQLHQIAMNLITNAHHAVELEGGRITAQVSEETLEPDHLGTKHLAPGRYAVLSISDDGHGMPADLMANIFEPYYTTKTMGKGTGLGLAVAYGLVKEHNGEITVTSTVGEGTTFTVYLPIQEETAAPEQEKIQDGDITGTERILVVDDEAPIVKLERQMFERLGYRVTTCQDSMDALDVFESDPDGFDIVITDMAMPKMTGDQLTRKLLAISPELPIIICTGYSEQISAKKAWTMGAKGFVMKPIVKSELAQMVRKALDAS